MNDWEASRSPLDAIWVAFTWRAVTAGLATTLAFIVVKRELLNIGATARVGEHGSLSSVWRSHS
jgi:hypothetical protein